MLYGWLYMNTKNVFGWEYNKDKTKKIYKFTENHKLIDYEDYQKRFPITDIENKWGKLPYLAKKYIRLSKKEIEVFENYKLPEGLDLRQFEFYYWKYYRLIKTILKNTQFDKYESIKEDLFQEATIKLFEIYRLIIGEGFWQRKLKQVLERHFAGNPVCQICRDSNNKLIRLIQEVKDYICPVCKLNYGPEPNKFSISFKSSGAEKETSQYYYKKKDKITGKTEIIKDDPLFNAKLIIVVITNHLKNYLAREYELQNFASYSNKKLFEEGIKEKQELTVEYRSGPAKEGAYKFEYTDKELTEYEKEITEAREPDWIIPGGTNFLDQDEIDNRDELSQEEAKYHYPEAHSFDSIGIESSYYSISEIANTIRKYLKGCYYITQSDICAKIDLEKMINSIKNITKRRCFILYCLHIVTKPKRNNPGEDCPINEREKPITMKGIGDYLGISQQAVSKNVKSAIKCLKKEFSKSGC